MPFDTFKQSCIDHGYTTRVSDYNLQRSPLKIYVMYTKNGIKTEIKPKHYTVGFGRSTEDLDVLETELGNKGFTIKRRTATLIDVAYAPGADILDRFWDIVTIEENIDSIVAKSRGVATRVFTKQEAEDAIFEKVAKRYFFAIENKDQLMLDMARTLLSGDDIDHLLTRGQSQARTEDDTYREHIVPCIMIHNKAIEMVLAGSSVVEVAQMVASNLGIVLISNAEQQLLDIDKGWRTTMPDGWNFGDNPLARLTQAGIALK